MKEEVKNLLTVGLITIAIIGGGILVINNEPKTGQSVDTKNLIKSDSNQTGTHGPFNKTINLVEFADYQCPACAYVSPVLNKIVTDYNGQINLVYRNFPLPQHEFAILAALAAEAAGEQGKFWEMHDKIYENQKVWTGEEAPTPKNADGTAAIIGNTDAYQIFMGFAQELGLNMDQFKQAVDSKKYLDKITSDEKDGKNIGIDSTPTIFVNGKKIPGGAPSYGTLKNLIDAELSS